MTNKFILILMIDNESVSEDIIFNSLKYMKKSNNNFILIGDISFYKKLKKKIFVTEKININKVMKKIFFFNVPINKLSNFRYINKITDTAILFLEKKIGKVIINMPINKKKYLSNKFRGYTEFFASKLNQSGKESMLLYNHNMSVLPVTTHCKISEISKILTKKKLSNAIKNTFFFYKKIIKKKINIKVLGLNPHAAKDFTEFHKSEERKIIIPIVKKFNKKTKTITGPISADTVFLKKNIKDHCVVGMYHDQVLPAFKALYEFNGLNITLGLKYFRLSPDHGTGFDLMKKNKKRINNKSFLYCIKFCGKYF